MRLLAGLLLLLPSAAQATSSVISGGAGGGDASAANQVLQTAKLTSTDAAIALIKTNSDKIPSSPSAEHTTAVSPNSCRLSDGAAFITTLPVSLSTLPALTAGSAVIGHVINDASSAVIGHIIADSGSTTAVTGTVTANATLSAETTKVIGTVNIAAAQTVGLAAGSAVVGHVIVDTAPTTAVSQSGTWTVQPGNTANTTAWKVDNSAVTQPISNANLDVALSTRLKPADTLTGVTTVTAVTAITNALPAGTNRIGSARLVDSADADLTAAKGSQASRAVSTQDLKDAGRNQTNYFMAIQIVTTGTDALISLTGYKGGAAVGATTTPAVVTSGKTYRITSITMDYTTIVTTPGSVRFTLRANTGGVVAITSPAVAIWEVGEPDGVAPVAGKKNTVHMSFPEGLEFAAGTGIGISEVGLNTVGTAAAVGYGRLTISGYEY